MLRRPLSSDFYARKLPWKRSIQSLLSPEQMHIAIQRESARADRSGGEFAMVLFRLQNTDRQALSTVRLAKIILKRVRATDDVGWYDDQNIGVLLPDTSAAGAWRFADQVCGLIQKKYARPAVRVYSYPKYIGNGEAQGNGAPRPATIDEDSSDDHSSNDHSSNGHSSRGPGGSNGSGPNGNGANGNGANGNGSHGTTIHRLGGHNGHANGKPRFNGNGNGNGHGRLGANGNGSANGSANGKSAGNLLPYFLDGVTSGGESQPTVVHSLDTLLHRPLPWWKRVLDIAGASVGLVLSAPILGVAAAAIKLTSPGPVMFTQQRAGLGGRPFTIYKLRTMCVDAEAKKKELARLNEQDGPAFKIKHDPRVTRVGAFLRKSSIDELPQLWNVLKGDMTLVGPRPLPINESEACQGWQRRRLDVTPGLTCIWQVKGRSQVSFADWVRMDMSYIRRRTLFNDLRILLQTVPAVLMRKGAR